MSIRRRSSSWLPVAIASRPATSVRTLSGGGSATARRIFATSVGRTTLGVVEELLVQLLARPQADDLDRLRIGVAPSESDQVSGEVHDLDRLPHIEDEQVAALAEGRRVQDQPRRLRDGHEVPRHLRIA